MIQRFLSSLALGALTFLVPVSSVAGDLFVHANYALYDSDCQNPVFLGVYEGSLYTATRARRLAALYDGYISGPIQKVVERAVDPTFESISQCTVTYSQTLFRDNDSDGLFSPGIDYAFARKYACQADTALWVPNAYFTQTDPQGNRIGSLFCAIAR